MTWVLLASLLQDGVEPVAVPAVRSLVYFARHQSPDGAWGLPPAGCRCPHPAPPAGAATVLDDATRALVAGLVEKLDADEVAERDDATARLVKLGERALPGLRAGTKSARAELRARCLQLVDQLTPDPDGPRVEVTGLILLSFFSAGYSHLSKDTYEGFVVGDMIRSALRWLISKQRVDGSFDPTRPMAEIMASLALSEAYGMTGSVLYKSPSQLAVDHAGGLKVRDGEALAWKAVLLRSAAMADLALPRGRIDDLAKALDDSKDPSAVAIAPAIDLWVRRKKDEAWEKKAAKIDPSTLAPEALFLAGISLLDEKGDRLKAWKEKADGSARAPRSSNPCEKDSWPGSGAFEDRLRRTALNTLVYEVRCGYFSPYLGK